MVAVSYLHEKVKEIFADPEFNRKIKNTPHPLNKASLIKDYHWSLFVKYPRIVRGMIAATANVNELVDTPYLSTSWFLLRVTGDDNESPFLSITGREDDACCGVFHLHHLQGDLYQLYPEFLEKVTSIFQAVGNADGIRKHVQYWTAGYQRTIISALDKCGYEKWGTDIRNPNTIYWLQLYVKQYHK